MKIASFVPTGARLALVGLLLIPALASAEHVARTVYTATNASDGNRILVFDRTEHGTLKQRASFPTGGTGTGGGLGNQSAIVMSENDNWLLTVNAGSNEISVFAVFKEWLVLTDVVPSGGKQPISLTIDHNLVYVLNAGSAVGDQDSISGFFLTTEGRLKAIPGSWRALSSASVGPAQVGFSPSGNVLVVTEKNTNSLDGFPVNENGLLAPRVTTPSAGATPFGFSFGPQERLFVSEASGGNPNASTASSYQAFGDAHLNVLTGALATGQSAACWLVLTPDGRFAYTTNTGSNTISGFAITNDGKLKLLQPTGVAALSGKTPVDAAVTDNGRFLYVLNSGDGSISGFAINHDGKLSPVETETGLPAGTNGLVAR